MKCFQCAKGKMTSKVTGMIFRVRGEEIPVKAEATVCSHCGFQVMTDEQSAAYTIASADAYRVKHGLLTSSDLKALRRRLRMSQLDFAKFLKVGVASVKRWESGLVQDEAMDELIRVKSDLGAARANLRRLEQRKRASKAAPEVIVVRSKPAARLGQTRGSVPK
jgi:putative zinc finger/helix-turn-helix YgiT family protein